MVKLRGRVRIKTSRRVMLIIMCLVVLFGGNVAGLLKMVFSPPPITKGDRKNTEKSQKELNKFVHLSTLFLYANSRMIFE